MFDSSPWLKTKGGSLTRLLNSDMNEFDQLYKELMNEGFLRRLGNRLTGAFSGKSSKSTKRNHALAHSIALDASKDITKLFKGDETTHYKTIYGMILKYIQTLNP